MTKKTITVKQLINKLEKIEPYAKVHFLTAVGQSGRATDCRRVFTSKRKPEAVIDVVESARSFKNNYLL